MRIENWPKLSWTQKHKHIHDVFGSDNSDSHGDALLYLWDQIHKRQLEGVFIAHLADILKLTPAQSTHGAIAIIYMMTVDPTDTHWVAALRAAGHEVEL